MRILCKCNHYDECVKSYDGKYCVYNDMHGGLGTWSGSDLSACGRVKDFGIPKLTYTFNGCRIESERIWCNK